MSTKPLPPHIGIPSSPRGLAVALGDTAGTMQVTWDAVKTNRGYLLQCAEGRPGDPNPAWTLVTAPKPKVILPGMTIGTSYVFRVTSLGGKDGHSGWSPVVVRVAG